MHAKWEIARRLRRSGTEAERRLWQSLRGRQMHGLKFRRQYPISGSIADFACIEAGLVIELDGGQHNEPARAGYDQRRTEKMQEAGYRVLRFWNNELSENLEGVLEAIRAALPQPHPAPPLLAGERE